MSMYAEELRSAGWQGFHTPINDVDLTLDEAELIRDRIEGYLDNYIAGCDTEAPLYGIHLDQSLYVTDGGEYDYRRYRQQHRIVQIEDILLASPTTSTHASWRQS